MISIQHYYGNIIDSNHGNETQPNKYFKVFKNHRVNEHILTLILSMKEDDVKKSGEPEERVAR